MFHNHKNQLFSVLNNHQLPDQEDEDDDDEDEEIQNILVN